MVYGNESFIKVGKTYCDLKKSRFKSVTQIPYKWSVIRIIEGDSKYISELECLIHKEFASYTYSPKENFGGSTECFTLIADKISSFLDQFLP